LFPRILTLVTARVSKASAACSNVVQATMRGVVASLYRSHGPEGRIASIWPTGAMVLWIAILLGVTLVVNFVS